MCRRTLPSSSVIGRRSGALSGNVLTLTNPEDMTDGELVAEANRRPGYVNRIAIEAVTRMVTYAQRWRKAQRRVRELERLLSKTQGDAEAVRQRLAA